MGALLTFNHEHGGLGITGGVHLNDFESQHSRDVVDGAALYTNQGFKREASGFAKIHYDRAGLRLFGDAQVRHSSFRYEGDLDIGSVDWTFFNPKLGARYALRPSLSVYASARPDHARAHPQRPLHGRGQPEPRLRPPRGEAGARRGLRGRGRVLGPRASRAGQPLRDGAPQRDRADRRAVGDRPAPCAATWTRAIGGEWSSTSATSPTRALRLTATANASANRIATWNQSFDVYEADGSYSGSRLRTYHDVRPLLTPQFVGNLGADYTPAPGVTVGLAGRYVSTSQLDNTDDPALATPSFFDLSAHASLSLARWVKKGEPRLRVQVNNVLGGRQHWPSGYSYLFVTRDEAGGETFQGTPYYYPQATRSVFVNLDVRF